MNYVEKIVETIAMVILFTMLLTTTAQVFFRTFLTSLPWTEELARFSYVWLCYTGSAVVLRNAKHIKMDLLDLSKFPRASLLVELLLYLLNIYVLYYITVAGYEYAMTAGRVPASALPIRLRSLYMTIPVGFGLMCLFTLERVLKLVANWYKGGEHREISKEETEGV